MALIPKLVIIGTPDNDELIAAPTRPWTGLEDDNTIQGLEGDDRIFAGGGNDLIDGGPGDDTIDGGSGTDTAVYSQTRQAYEVFSYRTAGDRRDAVVRGPDGLDSLISVEFLSFSTPSGVRDRVSTTDFPAFPALDYAASYPDLASAFGANPDLAWAHFRDFGAKEDRTVTFNALNYLASYPELAALLGTDPRQGTLHYLQYGRLEGRTVTFDGLQYVAGYDDIAAVLGPLGNAQAINDAGARHFLTYGRAEGRQPGNFDPDQYLANYPGLGAAGLDTPDQLALHYILYGPAARLTYEAPPDGLAYIASYPDLSAAFGTDARQGTFHWLQYGRFEGRTATFDGLQYAGGYDDIAAVLGPLGNMQAIKDAGARPYLTYGRAEGRQSDNFDPEQYLANYPGLGAAGVDTPDELALHYILYGRAAGLSFEPLIA
jgi:RTX calcium-binding nonapeptide repeat (4 copies)